MNLYFFDDVDDLDCGFYMNDGNCDPLFNNIDYLYDKGDCCASTCIRSNCGIGGLTSVFGNANISGDGYPNCRDPAMVPITIRLDNIFSNHNDVRDIPWNDLPLYSYFGPSQIEDLIQLHLEKEPVGPLLQLYCNDKNVISVYVDESMKNASETVMVEDGAKCTLTVQTVNTNSNHDYIETQVPILQINYTIFHGDKSSIEQNPIVIISEQTGTQYTRNDFRIVFNCYFEKLSDYFDNSTMYTGTTPANEAINWLMDNKRSNSRCNNPFFIERYALGVQGFSSPVTQLTMEDEEIFLAMDNVSSSSSSSTIDSTVPTQWLSSERQCAWQQIICKKGSVVSLTLVSTEESLFEGTIATELGLLTNLEKLLLSKFLFCFYLLAKIYF